MPCKNKKAHQAKAQHTQDENYFKKEFFDNLDNPDWVTKGKSDSRRSIGMLYCAYESICFLTESKSQRKGLSQKQVEYAVKKYCSHHKVGAGI